MIRRYKLKGGIQRATRLYPNTPKPGSTYERLRAQINEGLGLPQDTTAQDNEGR